MAKLTKYTFILIAVIFSGAVFLSSGMTDAADENADLKTPPPVSPIEEDTLADSAEAADSFMELHLTPNGAYGVDKSGNEWDYDFTREEFIRQGGDSQGTETVFGRREVIEVPDIEELKNMNENDLAELKRLKGLKLGTVIIGVDEKILGPVVAVGPVTVRGVVIGDVVSYKKITVTSTGEIQGNARAPEIVKMRGGVITGSRVESEFPTIPEVALFSENRYTALIVNVSILAGLLICGLLIAAVVPKAITRIKSCMQKNFFKSFFIGFLVVLAFGPLMALLSLTVIGIPVALIALPIALFLAAIMGIVGLGNLAGDILSRYFGGLGSSQIVRVVSGLIVLDLFWIIMSLLMVRNGGFLDGFSTLFMVLAIVIWSIGLMIGLGAVVMTRFGKRECGAISIEIKVDKVKPPPPPTPPPLSPED